MTRTTILLALVPLFLGAGLAPEASAQSVSFSIGKQTRRGGFALHVGTEGFGASYARSRSCTPPRFSRTGHPGYSRRVVAPQRPYPVHRTWVPAHCHRRWEPARYETRHDPCGRSYRVLVREGRWVTTCRHGRWSR
jgi:hypothetical protein